MALTKLELIQELKHQIHSPLAAIRNALYLAAVRTSDPEIQKYLALADAEASSIAAALKNANQIDENKRVCTLAASLGGLSAA
jgi:two-component sensor histidine kinase